MNKLKKIKNKKDTYCVYLIDFDLNTFVYFKF